MDRTVRAWDIETLRPVGEPFLPGHTNGITALAVAAREGGLLAVSGDLDGGILMWDVANGRPLGAAPVASRSWVMGLAASELDGDPVLVSGSFGGTLSIWDPERVRMRVNLPIQITSLTAAGGTIVAGGAGGELLALRLRG
jgi:WD40 repeat protein